MDDYTAVLRAADRLQQALAKAGGIPKGLTSADLANVFRPLAADDLEDLASDLRMLARDKREADA
jgi:hypothetical protein